MLVSTARHADALAIAKETAESMRVGDPFTEHVVIDVGVRVNVHHSDRTMLSFDCPKNGQRDRMIPTQRQRNACVAQDLIVGLFDDCN